MPFRRLTGTGIVFLSVLVLVFLGQATGAAAMPFTTLYSFQPTTDGFNPNCTIAANGRMYGTTRLGGTYGFGTAFELSASGVERVLYNFKNGPDGAFPDGLAYMNGTLYGIAHNGGYVFDGVGQGVVFAVSEAGAERVVYAFKGGTDASFPSALTAMNGTLYVTTAGGTYGAGTVSVVGATGRERVLHSFRPSTDGSSPSALVAVNGMLYGAVFSGPSNDPNSPKGGALFSLSASGVEETLYSFKGPSYADGANPNSVVYANGRLYGTTLYGGAGVTFDTPGYGTIFEATLSGAERVIHRFGGSGDGTSPSGLTIVDGALFGTTSGNASAFGTVPIDYSDGTVFTYSAGTERVLYTFKGNDDGVAPSSLVSFNGELYGVAFAAGQFGFGDVFALGANGGGFRIAHAFHSGPDGQFPGSGLIAAGGLLHGTTLGGGPWGAGTVFEAGTTGSEHPLYGFTGGRGGAEPNSLLMQGGEFYGSTTYGGEDNLGTVFAVTSAGVGRTIFDFVTGPMVGELPDGLSALLGSFYGTTTQGGTYDAGAVYTMNALGNRRLLYLFKGGYQAKDPWDGADPTPGLVAAGNLLYGTTQLGSLTNTGTVYSVSLDGVEKILYRFRGGSDGATPAAGLVALGGVFYGTTSGGGDAAGDGTVFEITPAGKERVVYRFKGGTDGANPQAALIVVNGALYGTTARGGTTCNCGTIFAVTPDGTEHVVYRFAGTSGQSGPSTPLTYFNGLLYGTTSGGGAYGLGSIYVISP
jgi:uncharacterized repeat protein (TIGR03803 family)